MPICTAASRGRLDASNEANGRPPTAAAAKAPSVATIAMISIERQIDPADSMVAIQPRTAPRKTPASPEIVKRSEVELVACGTISVVACRNSAPAMLPAAMASNACQGASVTERAA